jgi:hypothetical protein
MLLHKVKKLFSTIFTTNKKQRSKDNQDSTNTISLSSQDANSINNVDYGSIVVTKKEDSNNNINH